MSGEPAHGTTHRVDVAAPAGVVYALLADASKWPLYLSPKVHVERLECHGGREGLRMWSLLDGRLASWTSWRRLDPVERRVEFRQELPAAPLPPLSGLWRIHDRGPHDTGLELRYDGPAPGGLPAGAARTRRATDLTTRTELTELKHLAERWTRLDDLVLSFEDSMRINGPAELAYDFLYRAGNWPGLVPHVARADLTEDAPGVQRLTMETLTEHGSHLTESVRICFPHAGRIVYKQTVPAAHLAAHTGEWSVVPDETGVTVTAKQNVMLREESLAAQPGGRAGLALVRRQVRETLGRNCLALLTLARQHAESAVRML